MDDRLTREGEESRLVDAGRQLHGESDPVTFDAMLRQGRNPRDAGELREADGC